MSCPAINLRDLTSAGSGGRLLKLGRLLRRFYCTLSERVLVAPHRLPNGWQWPESSERIYSTEMQRERKQWPLGDSNPDAFRHKILNLMRHHFRPSATRNRNALRLPTSKLSGLIVTFAPPWLFPKGAIERQDRRYAGGSETGSKRSAWRAAMEKTRTAEFMQLLTSSQSRIYAYVLSLVLDPAQADDVLQKTNVVLWEKESEFELGTNFIAWAFRTAYLQVCAFRKQQQREWLVFDDEILQELSQVASQVDETFETRQQLAARLP